MKYGSRVLSENALANSVDKPSASPGHVGEESADTNDE
jgi:hypothetical protein